MHAVLIPILVIVVAVASIVRDAVSSMRAHARMDVYRREWSGLSQLDGRTAEWWRRELDQSFRARFTYRRLSAARPSPNATADPTTKHQRRRDVDPAETRRMTTLIRQAWAFSALVGTLAGWVTHSYVRGLILAGLVALATVVPAYFVQRLQRAPSGPPG